MGRVCRLPVPGQSDKLGICQIVMFNSLNIDFMLDRLTQERGSQRDSRKHQQSISTSVQSLSTFHS